MLSRFSINSSSKSSTSSATPVGKLIAKWGNSSIISCVLGISKIGETSKIYNDFSHAALLLLQKEIDDNMEEEKGILVEYGDYNPEMCDQEKKYAEEGLVIYHYGKKGGLRYYTKNYGEFTEEFGNIGYVDLKIDEVNQQTFEVFINKIAKVEDNKWIKENYSVGLLKNFNCQTFAKEALKVIKPHYNCGNIFPEDPKISKKKTHQQKLIFIPSEIRPELIKYYRK